MFTHQDLELHILMLEGTTLNNNIREEEDVNFFFNQFGFLLF
jgi:hypothetical protein